MDEQEQEELLYRLDERTERIEDELLRRVNELEREMGETQGETTQLDKRVQKNENHLAFVKAGVASLLTLLSGVGAKVFGLIQI